MKLSSAGSQLWTFQRGSTADDSATALEIDSYGDLILAGWTAGSLDGNSNAGSVDLFAMKVDAQGSWEWTFQTGTAREEWAGSLQIIPSGRILLAGSIKNGLGGSDQSAEMTKNIPSPRFPYVRFAQFHHPQVHFKCISCGFRVGKCKCFCAAGTK